MLVFVCTILPVRADPKTDVIVLTNGDRITGEIKSVEAAILTLSTDSAGTLSIEWVRVASLTSHTDFQFEMANGCFSQTLSQ